MVTKQTKNPTFVSWLIQKKSGKTPLETIPLYINHKVKEQEENIVVSFAQLKKVNFFTI